MTDTSRGGDSPAEPGGSAASDTAVDGMGLVVRSAGSGGVVVEVQGELDMLTAPQLRREVVERLPDSAVVVLALDGVSFLGTSGLAALIELREHAQSSGTRLGLACTERRVLRPLAIAGLVGLFDIHDSVDDALSALL